MTATRSIELGVDTSAAQREVRALREELEGLGRQVEIARAGSRIQVLQEPLTYEARLVRDTSGPRGFRAISTRENHCYIRDFVLAQTKGEQNALDRLTRHSREMKVLAESRERIFHLDVNVDFEARAVNWTNGSGGYFAPPLWIVERFAVQPTPERVLSRLAPQFELPEGAQSVSIPAFTLGPEMGATQLGAAPPGGASVDFAISSAVTTIAGNYDVPMQMLEQSPQGAHLDWVVFTAMEARYGYKLELQLLTGTGSTTPQGSGNNQLLGILNNTAIPTGNNIVYTDATPTGSKFIQVQSTQTGGGTAPQAIAAIGNRREIPPEFWMMTTSRAAWITSAEVALPLALSNQTGPGHFDLLAYPVRQNDAIPTNLGVGANQDTVILCRPSDWLILESESRTSVMTDTLSGTLQARLQMRRYVAALLREPTSVAYTSGTGMVVQTQLGF